MIASYHRVMHTTCLCLSAMMFKCASSLLGSAINHNARLGELRHAERTRSFGVRPVFDDTTGFMTADTELPEGVFWFRGKDITPVNKWIDAKPCSDFDPIHPDYIDHYLEK